MPRHIKIKTSKAKKIKKKSLKPPEKWHNANRGIMIRITDFSWRLKGSGTIFLKYWKKRTVMSSFYIQWNTLQEWKWNNILTWRTTKITCSYHNSSKTIAKGKLLNSRELILEGLGKWGMKSKRMKKMDTFKNFFLLSSLKYIWQLKAKCVALSDRVSTYIDVM